MGPKQSHPAGFLINFRGAVVEYRALVLDYKIDIWFSVILFLWQDRVLYSLHPFLSSASHSWLRG